MFTIFVSILCLHVIFTSVLCTCVHVGWIYYLQMQYPDALPCFVRWSVHTCMYVNTITEWNSAIWLVYCRCYISLIKPATHHLLLITPVTLLKRCRLFDAKQLVLYMLIYLQDACSVSNRATMSAVVQTVRCFTIIAGVSICNLPAFVCFWDSATVVCSHITGA